jgi:tRNA(fMet)-specific endonuclease VapC
VIGLSRPAIYLLDTNTISYIAIDSSPAARRAMDQTMRLHTIAISAITEGEVLLGLAKNPGAKAARLRASAELIFPRIQVLVWDSAAAHSYGTVRARLSSWEKTLSPLDMLIAAHAVSVGAHLVTHDKAFSQVEGLSIVDWATDLS